MNTRLLARVRSAYVHDLVSPALAKRNMREYVRAMKVVLATKRGWNGTPKVSA